MTTFLTRKSVSHTSKDFTFHSLLHSAPPNPQNAHPHRRYNRQSRPTPGPLGPLPRPPSPRSRPLTLQAPSTSPLIPRKFRAILLLLRHPRHRACRYPCRRYHCRLWQRPQPHARRPADPPPRPRTRMSQALRRHVLELRCYQDAAGQAGKL